MAQKLIEGAVDAIKTYLAAKFAAKVAALNTEYNDGITIEDMKAWRIDYLAEEQGFPIGIVYGYRGRPESEGDNYVRGEHVIDLVFVATDQNVETLRRKLFRYVRAAIELVQDSRASIGYLINIGDWDFSDTYASQSSFLSGAKLTIYPKKYEVR